MSHKFFRSGTRSPSDGSDAQTILNLDSSPGSCRKYTEDGQDGQVHIPKFSEEVSRQSDSNVDTVKSNILQPLESQAGFHLTATNRTPTNTPSKSILKRRTSQKLYVIKKTRGKTKCCHPLVNKIKHLAYKKFQKHEEMDNQKSPEREEVQEIQQLKCSPGAARRQEITARKTKEHIYEDIEDKRNQADGSVQYDHKTLGTNNVEYENKSNSDKEVGSLLDKGSLASHDPSLVEEDAFCPKGSDFMEKFYKMKDEDSASDSEVEPDEPNIIISEPDATPFTLPKRSCLKKNDEEAVTVAIDISPPTPNAREIKSRRTGCESTDYEWSIPSSDHESKIFEKLAENINSGKYSSMDKTKYDGFSSNTSLSENIIDPNELNQFNDKADVFFKTKASERNIEERFNVDTNSTISRTDCELSTSHDQSSNIETLPLKRDSRFKYVDKVGNQIQQRLRGGRVKLITQAEKLKTGLQKMKTSILEIPRIYHPETSKFSSKITMPKRLKVSLPIRKKFRLPNRPKFKNMNISKKLNIGDSNRFSLPMRSKFNQPKMKKPERQVHKSPKMSYTEDKTSSSSVKKYTGVEFEAKTYPRLKKKKKNELPKTSSSATLNIEDIPSSKHIFTKVKKTTKTTSQFHTSEYPKIPRENQDIEIELQDGQHSEIIYYDFDNMGSGGMESKPAFYDYSNTVSRSDILINKAGTDSDPLIDGNKLDHLSTQDLSDYGYYTFPPVRPFRLKHKNKDFRYIDDDADVRLDSNGVDSQVVDEHDYRGEITMDDLKIKIHNQKLKFLNNDSNSNTYANDDNIECILPMSPKRNSKIKRNRKHSLPQDFQNSSPPEQLNEIQNNTEEIIVHCTQHEFFVPQPNIPPRECSPLPRRRKNSRISRGTPLQNTDNTTSRAESLTFDTYIQTDEVRSIHRESQDYATVDKTFRSASKTPPVRRSRSSSSYREYYTSVSTRPMMPSRQFKKKLSSEVVKLASSKESCVSDDFTQYVEIDEPKPTGSHKDLCDGLILRKMKGRPLPPPPRPPRGPKRNKLQRNAQIKGANQTVKENGVVYDLDAPVSGILEVEVSTQTDQLPDDVDYELCADEKINDYISRSLKDVVDVDSMITKDEISFPDTSVDKCLIMPDTKIAKLKKPNVGRTSPTVILVERRVTSPTPSEKINEPDEILTQASLTVQHIDIDESQIPSDPPLPIPKLSSEDCTRSEHNIVISSDPEVKEVSDQHKNVQLENLTTQLLDMHNLGVSQLNDSEVDATEILVSEIEGLVNHLDTDPGLIAVGDIEVPQFIIDEIITKFQTSNEAASSQAREVLDSRLRSVQEQTQTDILCGMQATDMCPHTEDNASAASPRSEESSKSQQHTPRDISPQMPRPLYWTPSLYSYLQEVSHLVRDRPFSEFASRVEFNRHSLPTGTRRSKRNPATHHDELSSDEEIPRPFPRRVPPPGNTHESTVIEAGSNFLRVFHNSVNRTLRNMLNSLMSFISGTEDKKDLQMALAIFLLLIAGLVMFGLGDNRTIHHHHWEFLNPPNSKQ